MEFLRRRFGLIFRCLVSVLCLGWLYHKIDWVQFGADARSMEAVWVVFAFLCFFPVLLITAWRWRLLLHVHGVDLSYWRSFELGMVGQFFNAMLLGTTGGDVVKIFYAALIYPKKKAAAAFTVIVDRVIGLVALLLFGVVLSSTQLDLLFSTGTTRAATVAFYFFALGGVLVTFISCFVPFLFPLPWVKKLILLLPYQSKVQALLNVYEKSSRALSINAISLLGSFPSHIFYTLMGYGLMRAMHLHPPLLPFIAMVAIVNMLIALPVSMSGIGLRETLFVSFFALLKINPEPATVFSITYFGLTLLWSLIGGLFYLFYRHETHAPAPKVAVAEVVEA